ncbi:MAG TPA: hypothetical protein VMK84_36435 [Streptosporangiaceae bacterium]|nr:hypothetical protein [Streptosporangiaceae bacterium]
MPGLTRSLAEITADAMQADCGECWPGAGHPCDVPGGTHLARYARACRRGVISDYDMGVVLGPLDVFEPSTVIRVPLAVAS